MDANHGVGTDLLADWRSRAGQGRNLQDIRQSSSGNHHPAINKCPAIGRRLFSSVRVGVQKGCLDAVGGIAYNLSKSQFCHD